jgi:uncharacterized membrane protein
MKNNSSSFITYIGEIVKKLFVNGLISVLPLLLTIAIFNILFRFIKSLLEPVRNLIMRSSPFIPTWLQWVPHIEIIGSIIFIVLLGTILNIFIFQSVLRIIEAWFSKIPLVRPVYSGMKQLVRTFGSQDKNNVQQVVLLKLTDTGIRTIGFVTGELSTEISPHKNIVYKNVFVPTTPTPTNGFYIIVPEQDLIPLNITRQEALTLIMSLGMIQPNNHLEN